MRADEAEGTAARNNPGLFANTRWSLVLSAGRSSSPGSRQALATLCETYWRPLYAYVRNRGYPEEEAKDLTQEFFARFLEKNYLKDVHRERGRFRSFLLASLKHFLANEWDKATAQKRGGGKVPLSLDFALAEGWVSVEPSHDRTPEKIYERQWALALLDRVLEVLEADYKSSEKGAIFVRLKPLLAGSGEGKSYKEIAMDLNLSEGSIKVAAHRLKRKYRDALREEIAQTIENAEDIDDEMRYLLTVL
jgi:RNA polymerase sigma-70 factor (ECF subfamily)